MMEAISQKTGISLGVLLEDLVDPAVLQQYADVLVSGLASDSRKVDTGDMFIAYQGLATHGLLYAKDVVKKGAAVVLWDDDCDNCEDIIRDISNQAVCLRCEDLKAKVGEIADRFYQSPSSELNMIGVTGTDGKTSITHFIAQCLGDKIERCGILGTLGNGFLDELNPTGLTTADALNIHQSLTMMRDAGAKHAVMEVSSHGLDQGRINAVSFDAAVFSNFSQDHLDYHNTLEDYAAAKRKLFFMPGLKVAIINLDDEYGRVLAEECKQRLCVWGYSTNPDVSELQQYANFIVHARTIEAIENGFHISVKTPKGSGSFNVGLLGMFNVSNVLAALATLLVSNVPFDEAVNRLSGLYPVAGRMEEIVVSGKPAVIVDFAHTAKGIESACKAVREHFQGRLWCVFGCGGDRDQAKRPLMAKTVEQYADNIVVTSDNPRHEDPKKIIDEIVQGFGDNDDVKVVVDRKEAIAYAISHAGKNDVVLLAGKGHESSQIVGDTYIAFDDRRIARECLGVLG
jgi:UDP-N-acetylmuramoyl-L-alanyl-D-glutamate--2,6-diaminopimelate ligase